MNKKALPILAMTCLFGMSLFGQGAKPLYTTYGEWFRSFLPQDMVGTSVITPLIFTNSIIPNIARKDDLVWKPGENQGSVLQIHPTEIEYKSPGGQVVPIPMNKDLSPLVTVAGAGNTAGLMGYRFIDKGVPTNHLTFAHEVAGWAAGDRVSIINKTKYPDCATIVSISETNEEGQVTVTFDRILQIGNQIIEEDQYDSKVVYVVAKPDKGDVPIGYGASAEGLLNQALNTVSHAEGYGTKALGEYSHAEGRETIAQYAAHAEGQETRATGERSHAEGYNTTASGNRSHAEGHSTEASGFAAHAEGGASQSSGRFSHAEGYNTKALATASPSAAHATHAEGVNTQAGLNAEADSTYSSGNEGEGAHAEGLGSAASRRAAHAEGLRTFANGIASHAEGVDTLTRNDGEHAQGKLNVSRRYNGAFGNSGNTLHSIGIGNKDNGVETRKNAVEVMQDGKVYVLGVGGYTGTTNALPANGDLKSVIVSGQANKVSKSGDTMTGELIVPKVTIGTRDPTGAVGENSVSIGLNNTASGANSLANGQSVKATGLSSTAEGGASEAVGRFSHAEGYDTRAFSAATTNATAATHAEGVKTQAGSGAEVTAHSSGNEGEGAHAEGIGSAAAKRAAHAEGLRTFANGVASHAEGVDTITSNDAEHAQGRYNASHRVNSTFGNPGNTLHSIGIGSKTGNEITRENAVEVMQDGKVFVKGIGGYDGKTITGKQDLTTVINGIMPEVQTYVQNYINNFVFRSLKIKGEDTNDTYCLKVDQEGNVYLEKETAQNE